MNYNAFALKATRAFAFRYVFNVKVQLPSKHHYSHNFHSILEYTPFYARYWERLTWWCTSYHQWNSPSTSEPHVHFSWLTDRPILFLHYNKTEHCQTCCSEWFGIYCEERVQWLGWCWPWSPERCDNCCTSATLHWLHVHIQHQELYLK